MQTEARLQAVGHKAAARPEFAEILNRIVKMRPEIASRALASEKAKRVPAETMDALRDAGVFRLMQPKRFGGYEYGPAELAQIGFELGRACGSTGWCGTLAVCFGWMTAFYPLEAQQEVWDNTDNLLAVSYVPTPKVEAADGGFKISGSWPWASGVDSAAWLILAAMLPGKDGPPTLAWCLVPVSDVVVDHGSWNVTGLEGTGSKTVAIDTPVFVPNHRVLPLGRIFSEKFLDLKCPATIRLASGIPLSDRRPWCLQSSAWRKARSMPSLKRHAALGGWRGPASSSRSPNPRSFKAWSDERRPTSMRREL